MNINRLKAVLIHLILLVAFSFTPFEASALFPRRIIQACAFDRSSFQRSMKSLYAKLPEVQSKSLESFEEARMLSAMSLSDVELVRKYNLSENEVAALIAYTHRAYLPLNSYLRRDAFQDKHSHLGFRPFLQTLASAVIKIAPYEGLSFRTSFLPKEKISLFKPGDILMNDGFLSSSKKSSTPFIVGFGQQLLKIESLTGRSISDFSAYPEEAEVLFSPGTCFEVRSVENMNDSDLRVTLEEVPESDLPSDGKYESF